MMPRDRQATTDQSVVDGAHSTRRRKAGEQGNASWNDTFVTLVSC